MSVKPIPDAYRRVTPYLYIDGAAAAIDFYCRVLGATERMRLPMPGDKIGHAELELGDSVIMLADEFPDMDVRGPKTIGGTSVSLMVYVDDVDAIVAKALDAGATLKEPVEEKFYGDRAGQIEDPFGHVWSIATHVEDIAPEEMAERMKQYPG